MYEAVIGYTEDEEIATWGAGDSAEAAIWDAVERFIVDADDYIEPGDYEATVYDEPLTRDRGDGDAEVYAWSDRGTVTVTLTLSGEGAEWTVGEVDWDGVGVTP